VARDEGVVARVYETVLYARDVPATAAFYANVLGLRPIGTPDELAAAFRLADGGMLLVFDPVRASAPGRRVPSHGTSGPGHVALAVAGGALERIEETLRDQGIDIEREVGWEAGGRSLYVRDPAGNSVELIEGEAWPP
jgi:catechol 2,3-dioxygenase-like lactoylglutathione lyase family enzyme